MIFEQRREFKDVLMTDYLATLVILESSKLLLPGEIGSPNRLRAWLNVSRLAVLRLLTPFLKSLNDFLCNPQSLTTAIGHFHDISNLFLGRKNLLRKASKNVGSKKVNFLQIDFCNSCRSEIRFLRSKDQTFPRILESASMPNEPLLVSSTITHAF